MPLVAVAIVALLFMQGLVATQGTPCGVVQQATGACGYENGDLVIRGETSGPAESSAGSAANIAPVDRSDAEQRWLAYLASLEALCNDMAEASWQCAPPGATAAPNANPTTPVAPITIEDLAAFRPIVGELVVEPDGWGVVGTPTNFYATAESHTMQGDLLGSAVTVRWTPTTYAFDYGDGTTQTTEGSGAAWRGTGEQWTETSTSHAYASRDDVTASLTVTFTAEVDAGGGWFQVPGSLPVTAPAVAVKVFEVDTVLTAGDCAAAPTAPGCG